VASSFNIAAAVHGYGRHIDDPSCDVNKALKYTVISEPLNAASLLFVKLSIGGTLARLGLGRGFMIIIIVALVIEVLGNMMAIISETAACKPYARSWNYEIKGSCWPTLEQEVSGYVSTGANIIADLVFATSPEWFLRRVNLNNRDRQLVRALLFFMLIATVVSIVKLSELPAITVTEDPTWVGVALTINSLAEMDIAIIAACLPCLRTLVDSFLPRSKNKSYGSNNSDSASHGRSARRAHVVEEITELDAMPKHGPTTRVGDLEDNVSEKELAVDKSGIYGGPQMVRELGHEVRSKER